MYFRLVSPWKKVFFDNRLAGVSETLRHASSISQALLQVKQAPGEFFLLRRRISSLFTCLMLCMSLSSGKTLKLQVYSHRLFFRGVLWLVTWRPSKVIVRWYFNGYEPLVARSLLWSLRCALKVENFDKELEKNSIIILKLGLWNTHFRYDWLCESVFKGI